MNYQHIDDLSSKISTKPNSTISSGLSDSSELSELSELSVSLSNLDDLSNLDHLNPLDHLHNMGMRSMAAEEALKALESNPSTQRLYNEFIMKRFSPQRDQRSSSLIAMIPFLYKAVGLKV
jgi:hypothetical protein